MHILLQAVGKASLSTQDTRTVKSLFNCCGSMTSPTTQNLNITLSASSRFLYKVIEHKSPYDVDDWRTGPGRHAQFSVKKISRSEQVRGGKSVRGLCDSAILPSFPLPGYMVQLICLEAVNLQFNSSSEKVLTCCSAWTD